MWSPWSSCAPNSGICLLITHRSIVSSSGYTGAAIKKAKAHNVGLFTWKPWTKPLSEQFPKFPDTGTPAEFLAGFQTKLLYWDQYRLNLVCPGGPTSFSWTGATPIVEKSGRPHEHFTTMTEYMEALLLRSTEIVSTRTCSNNSSRIPHLGYGR